MHGIHDRANCVDLGYALNAYPQGNTVIAIDQSLQSRAFLIHDIALLMSIRKLIVI